MKINIFEDFILGSSALKADRDILLRVADPSFHRVSCPTLQSQENSGWEPENK